MGCRKGDKVRISKTATLFRVRETLSNRLGHSFRSEIVMLIVRRAERAMFLFYIVVTVLAAMASLYATLNDFIHPRLAWSNYE